MENPKLEEPQPCPSCGASSPLKKSWLVRRRRGLNKPEIMMFRIFHYKCPKCGRDFRKGREEGSQ